MYRTEGKGKGKYKHWRLILHSYTTDKIIKKQTTDHTRSHNNNLICMHGPKRLMSPNLAQKYANDKSQIHNNDRCVRRISWNLAEIILTKLKKFPKNKH